MMIHINSWQHRWQKFWSNTFELLLLLKYPPYTYCNLILYSISPYAWLRRSSYASMWGVMVSFEVANFVDTKLHSNIARKQNMTDLQFRLMNILVHWVPLYICYVPFRGFLVNLVGACINIVWGILISKGNMNLSHVYVPLTTYQWHFLFVVSCVATICVPI